MPDADSFSGCCAKINLCTLWGCTIQDSKLCVGLCDDVMKAVEFDCISVGTSIPKEPFDHHCHDEQASVKPVLSHDMSNDRTWSSPDL